MIRKQTQYALLILCIFIASIFSDNVNADEDAEIQQAIDAYQEKSWELGLAAGYGMRSNPLINSDDIPLYVVFDIAWFGDWFFFDNGDLGLNLHETDKLSINFIAHVNNERGVFEWFNNSQLGVQVFTDSLAGASIFCDDLKTEVLLDSPPDSLDLEIDTGSCQETGQVKAPKRSFAVDGGLEIIYADVWGDLQLQVLSDLSLTHKGVEIWASYAYSWHYGNWRLTPSFGLNWKSSNLLDYYYGVRDSEARENRPAYKASSGFNHFARLSVSYTINDHWGLVGVAEYETLSRSIRNSPIVNKDSVETLFVGIMYRF